MGRTLYAYADRVWEPIHRFTYTGEPREFTLDPGEYLFICNGAQGGNGNTNSTYWCWNYGATAYGIFETDQTETLYAVVGGEGGALSGATPGEGGYNGGGRGGYHEGGSNAAGSGGGGASDIRLTLDDTIVLHPQRNDVPATYEECWYMRRNWGDQGCFNTGYRLSNDTRVELDLKIQGLSVTNGGNWCCICGQRSGNNSGDQFIIETKYNGNIGACAIYRSNSANNPKVPSGPNKQFPYDQKFSMTVTTAQVSWVSETGETNSIDDIPVMTTNPANQDFVLFAYMNNGSPYYDEQFGLRIYECKIYENDVLMHDFVPVKRVSDSAPGFFDTVTQTFKEITGTLHAISYEKPTKSLLSRILVAAGGGGDCNWSSNNYSYIKNTYGGGEIGSWIDSDREKKSSFGLWATQTDGPHSQAFGKGRNGNVLSGSYGSYSQYGSGGGGGGWFGGTSVWNQSGSYATQPGAGGSSYALTATSHKPYGYIPTSHYYLKNTNLVPCQSEHNGSIIILKPAISYVKDDKIIVPLQDKETKIKLFPGKYNIKCYGGEGGVDDRATGDGYRFYGGLSEGTLTLTNLHEIYGVVGGSGLWYDMRTYNQTPWLFNKYVSYNGGGIGVRTAGWSRPLCGGGGTDLRLTMDTDPVHEPIIIPDPDSGDLRDDIPEGYTQLKAIYASTYFDPGYVVKANSEFHLDVSIEQNEYPYYPVLFGVQNDGSGGFAFFPYVTGRAAHWQLNDSTSGYAEGNGSKSLPLKTRLTIDTDSTSLTWASATDGETLVISNGRSIHATNASIAFGCDHQNTYYDTSMTCNWYNIRISESGVLVHDFVTVVRDSDNVAGFYDMVTDTFYEWNYTKIEFHDTVQTFESKTLMSRFIVAGGGGGRGYGSGYGGKGGGTTGGTQTNGNGVTGGPGTQTSSPAVAGHPESNGGFGYGGAGYVVNSGRAGSGGGGWYGGSGSHPNGQSSDNIKGGNGGSGYVLTEESYKPEYYIPTEEFYLSEASTTLGGNQLIPNMSRIEIEVVKSNPCKVVIHDSEGYKEYDEENERWVWFADEISDEDVDEHGTYVIDNLTGVQNEFDLIAYDPNNVINHADVVYWPKGQNIDFLIPRTFRYAREVIDASYDDTVYELSTKTKKWDNEYNSYIVTIEKKIDTDSLFKLYSIQLFAN